MTSGQRAQRSVAFYRLGWGMLQAFTAILVFVGRQIIVHASPHGVLRRWLRAMLAENTVIDQIRDSSGHLLGFHFRATHGAWILLGLGVLNIVFGWLILYMPYRARWIGMIVFGVGFLVGIGSVLLHPTWVRAGLTLLDLVFFWYFAWYLPRSLVAARVEGDHRQDS